MTRTPNTIAGPHRPNSPATAAATSMKPMMKPPSAAPTVLPMPPRTAAVNALQAGLEAEVEAGDAVLQAVDDAGGARERRPDEERDRDRAVDVHAHQGGGVAVVGRRAHRAPEPRAADEQLERDHQDHRDGDDEQAEHRDRRVADLDERSGREDLRRVRSGTGRRASWTTFWRMNETPIAVISGARRGALRSGRYANRSMTTPSRPRTTIVTANVAASRTIASRTEVGDDAVEAEEARQEHRG